MVVFWSGVGVFDLALVLDLSDLGGRSSREWVGEAGLGSRFPLASLLRSGELLGSGIIIFLGGLFCLGGLFPLGGLSGS